jgi:hypothetical protein
MPASRSQRVVRERALIRVGVRSEASRGHRPRCSRSDREAGRAQRSRHEGGGTEPGLEWRLDIALVLLREVDNFDAGVRQERSFVK